MQSVWLAAYAREQDLFVKILLRTQSKQGTCKGRDVSAPCTLLCTFWLVPRPFSWEPSRLALGKSAPVGSGCQPCRRAIGRVCQATCNADFTVFQVQEVLTQCRALNDCSGKLPSILLNNDAQQTNKSKSVEHQPLEGLELSQLLECYMLTMCPQGTK